MFLLEYKVLQCHLKHIPCITVSFLWFSLPVHSESLKRILYSKLYSLAYTFLLNVFSALKGTHLYIIFELKIVASSPTRDTPFFIFFLFLFHKPEMAVSSYRPLPPPFRFSNCKISSISGSRLPPVFCCLSIVRYLQFLVHIRPIPRPPF